MMSLKPVALLLSFLAAVIAFPAAACSPLASVPEAVASARVVVFGEVHGTNEAPDFVGRFLCAAARSGKPVVLALEIPTAEQDRIDAFIASDGEAPAVREFLSGPFWTRSKHDGRSSASMFRLVQTARGLRSTGAAISVLAFAKYDDRPGDAAMAETVESALERDEARRAVVLAGNGHASKSVGGAWNARMEPLGSFLSERYGALAFRMRGAGGSFWACIGGRCGVHERAGVGSPDIAPGELVLEEGIDGFDGYYFVGRTSASPPPHDLDPPRTPGED